MLGVALLAAAGGCGEREGEDLLPDHRAGGEGASTESEPEGHSDLAGEPAPDDAVAVLAPLQTCPRCLVVHESTGASSFGDLGGFTIAMNAGEPFAQFLMNGPLPKDVEIVPYTGGVTHFLRNEKHAQQGYSFSEPFLATDQGGDPKVLLVADAGFNPYTSCLFTRGETVKKDAELVRKMVAASVRGWRISPPKCSDPAARQRGARAGHRRTRAWSAPDDVQYITKHASSLHRHGQRWTIPAMLTAAQLRAARALLGIDQRQLAALAGVSLPTIQRMEASDGTVRGVVDTLMKVVEALDAAGIELIGPGQPSRGEGRGVRMKEPGR